MAQPPIPNPPTFSNFGISNNSIAIGGIGGSGAPGVAGGIAGGVGGSGPNPFSGSTNPTTGGGGVIAGPFSGTNPSTGGGGGRPYPGIPEAIPVPPSFFYPMSQPVGTYLEFSTSFNRAEGYVISSGPTMHPYPTELRVYAPKGPGYFDVNNWYFLNVGLDSTNSCIQIIFYEGDPSWITQGSVQFGDHKVYGNLHLVGIGNRYCVALEDRFP